MSRMWKLYANSILFLVLMTLIIAPVSVLLFIGVKSTNTNEVLSIQDTQYIDNFYLEEEVEYTEVDIDIPEDILEVEESTDSFQLEN